MPLRFDVKEYLGTNADHSSSNEYCHYCLKDGEYTVDFSLGEMVDIWVKYTDKYNRYAGTNYTPQELKTLLNKRLPTLKRWRQKNETQQIHSKTINRIKTYIDRNLFSGLEHKQLAKTANLSLFHFRRIFLNSTGENIGTYIQRLRLEYIAHLLIATRQPIEEIRKQTNYQTKFSLSKAFKKHFGISMSAYRTKYKSSISLSTPGTIPEVEIRRINTRQALCLEVGTTFRDEHAYKTIWEQLIHYKEKHLKETSDSHFISISLDNPFVTPVEQQRYYIGITAKQDPGSKTERTLFVREIPGGMYAVFRHKGSYSRLPGLYKAIYEEWFTQNRYFQKYPLTFEVYLNTPDQSAIDELITEIFIPIGK